MKKVLIAILITGAGFSAVAQVMQGDGPEVLGFRAWKTMRVDEARAALERTQAEGLSERAIPSHDKPATQKPFSGGAIVSRVQKGGKGESRLQQAQTNLEFASELTINDYFVLYLSQINDDAALLEAAKKMSVEEVAQLMTAYKKQLEGGRSAIGMLPSTLQGTRSGSGGRSTMNGL